MKTLISPSQLHRTVTLAALSMLALVLSGCVSAKENFNHSVPSKRAKRTMPDKISMKYMLDGTEGGENTEPVVVREPLVIVKEIPAGNPGEGTIVKTTTLFSPGVDVKYVYPNGYVSEGPKLDPEWRKKRPKNANGQSVDYFNFSGQPGSSGHTSGSVIRTF